MAARNVLKLSDHSPEYISCVSIHSVHNNSIKNDWSLIFCLQKWLICVYAWRYPEFFASSSRRAEVSEPTLDNKVDGLPLSLHADAPVWGADVGEAPPPTHDR